MRWRRVAVLIAVLAAIVAAVLLATSAPDVRPLFTATTIVTGNDTTNRAAGLARCLADVIVKLSGDPRLTSKPGFAAMQARAAALMEGFTYRDRMEGIPLGDEQGTRDRPFDLTVTFNRARIEAALHELGGKPWLTARPVTEVYIAVKNGDRLLTLTSEEPRGIDHRDALQAAANQLALPIIVPRQAQWALLPLTAEDLMVIKQTVTGRLQTAAAPKLLGALQWDSTQWLTRFTIVNKGQTHTWQGQAVSFDEAYRMGLRGAALVLSGSGMP
jgi:uncharacterized protein